MSTCTRRFDPAPAAVLLATILAASCASTSSQPADGPPDRYLLAPPPGDEPMLFDGVGEFHRDFTTSSELAHRYLVQGLVFVQGYLYTEAILSFREAARLDPDCAMAWWGLAYTQGPTYNIPMTSTEAKNLTYDALQEAVARIDNTTPTERALIEALQHRYAKPFPDDRSHLDQAYADAMRGVWARFPDDPDVGFLFAESLMILSPWALYDRETLVPTENTAEIVATLERVFEIDPNHPGACHAYIHSVEQSATPERALPAADRLCELTPFIAHMVHMPSHIYLRTGDWDRAVEQNLLAAEADMRYFDVRPKRVFEYASNIHNNHIAAWSAMMTGREDIALATSRAMWDTCPEEVRPIAFSIADTWMCSLYDAQKRFGLWDELLAEREPLEGMPITTCMWRASRAVAFAAKQDFASAEAELELFRAARQELPDDPAAYFFTDPVKVQNRMEVVEHFVPGEIALQQGDWDTAIRHLEQAVEVEDLLGFGGEPPDYLQPIRHTLGAVYMKAGRYADAERVYREDLREYAENGWSLYGLACALEAQAKQDEAAVVEAAFEVSWRLADEPLTTSCKCVDAIAIDG